MHFELAIVRLLACLGSLLLVSCIDGHEEYWVNSDGSGRAEITYSLPAAAARFQGGAKGVEKLLGNFLSTTPAITTSTHEVIESDGRLTAHVTANFDSVLALRNVADGGSMSELPPSATGLAGDIKLDRVGRHVHASRVVAVGKAMPGASFLPASQFAGHRLCYRIHLPVAATVSNATRIEDEGRTLIWDHSLAEAVRSPFMLRFEAPVTIPRVWVVGAMAILVTLIWVVCSFIRRRNRKAGAAPAAKHFALRP